MITLDASALIAHLQPGDIHHEVATRYLISNAHERMLIHSLNLAEVLVGAARVGRGHELADDLKAMGVEVAPAQADEALQLARLRVDTGLKLPDCCALVTALSTQSTVMTFDERLARVARARHLAVAPAIEE